MDVTPDGTGKVRKSVLEKGRDVFYPTVGFSAEISLREGFSTEEFRTVSYMVGDPEAHGVPASVDLAVRKMNTAEHCWVRSRNESSKGDEIIDGECYEVILNSFEKVTSSFFAGQAFRSNICLVLQILKRK